MLEMIWAQDARGAIGFQNRLLFSIPEDMSIFKTVTGKNPVIMGTKTYLSLPRKQGQSPLPGRYKYVVSRLSIPDSPFMDVEYISVEECLKQIARSNKRFIVIGGGEIYKLFLPYADTLHVVGILATAPNADTFAPHFDQTLYKKTNSTMIKSKSGYTFEYATWLKLDAQKEKTV